jgi:hypothetical protein
VGSLCAQSADSGRASAIEFFERRIRPVLAQDCYECHSASGKHKGGLVLDHRKAMLAGGDSGPAIVPGDPQASLLLRAIKHTDDRLQMPKARAPLSAAVIADFTAWIRAGAVDPRDGPPTAAELAADTDWNAVMRRRLDWWSFRPIAAPDPDALPAAPGATHPIDRFIADKLAAAHLTAAPRAEPGVLLRRLSFALRGLPPSAAEIEAFLGRGDAGSFGDVVDAWLGSPQFGERWARHWMDWLRYAESHGSEGDPLIPYAWRYRDYLIRALNADVPYDQLVTEHLAGDLLPSPRIDAATGIDESALGTGHLRMVFHGYAPTDALEELTRFTDDQIDVVGKAFLGLTISCARCHDHKFDPISQQDYTALYGIFASCAPATVAVDAGSDAGRRQRAALAAAKAALQQRLAAAWLEHSDALRAQLAQPDAAMQAAIAAAKAPADLLHPFFALQQGNAAPLAEWRTALAPAAEPAGQTAGRTAWDLAQRDDFMRWRHSGNGVADVSKAGAFAVAAEGPDVLLGIYPAGTYSHLLSSKDRGVLLSPHVVLSDKQDLWLQVAGDGGAAARYVVQNYPRDGSVFPIAALSGGRWHWQRFGLDYWTGDRIHVEFATAADQPVLANPDAVRSWFGVRQVRLLAAGAPAPAERCEFAAPLLAAFGEREPKDAAELATGYAAALRTCVQAFGDGAATDAQALLLDELLHAGLLPNQRDALPALAPLLDDCRRLEGALPVPTRAPGVYETEPVDAPLLLRGNAHQPGAPVARRSLSALGGAPCTNASGRRDLAADFVRADNPLLARVIVNRVWHHLFGRGLVATTDNFGHMGSEPSHPELLDYLARWLVAHHWSLKSLIRLIVTSAAWQRASEPPPGALAQDPDDVLLSHFRVRRLEAEAIRDALLAVAGDLQPEMYGPSVAGNAPRRSLYVRGKRNEPDAFLSVFDAPVAASCKGQRDATNVPSQSLTLLNDPFVLERADHWAATMGREPTEPTAAVDAMFVRAFGRPPSADERQRALAFVQQCAGEHVNAAAERQRIDAAVASGTARLTALTALATERVRTARSNHEVAAPQQPAPIAAWDFADGLVARDGKLVGRAFGKARVADGALVLDGVDSYVATPPLACAIGSKTLAAWVQLDNLTQQGGGVISLQDLDGNVFDAIVFAERQPRRWVAGSNGFARSDDFEVADEAEAADRFVHIALVYAADGTVSAYRDGAPYGAPYRRDGPVAFAAGNAQLLFGNRHGGGGGNRMLKGRIRGAALYDRALTAAEVAIVAHGADFVSADEVRAAWTAGERQERDAVQAALAADQARLDAAVATAGTASAWADLALALFNQKEFIYVR